MVSNNPSGPAGTLNESRRRRPEAAAIGTVELVQELLARIGEEDLTQHRLVKHLGSLWAELDLKCHLPPNRYSPINSRNTLWSLHKHPDFTTEFLHGATCVEVGCGALSPLGPMFVMLLAGASRVMGFEPEGCATPELAARALYNAAAHAWAGGYGALIDISDAELRRRIRGFDLARLAQGNLSAVDTDRLSLVRDYFKEGALPPASTNVLSSTSFLEHVPDPEAIVAAMGAAMTPGALGCHHIDGLDHRSHGDKSVAPLAFLEEDTDAPMVHQCNRVRPMHFTGIFEAHGLEVRKVNVYARISLQEEEIDRFAPPFKTLPRDVLECVGVSYWVRKR